MKKILGFVYFIVLLLIANFIPTKAISNNIKHEYVEVNIGNDSMLEEDGLEIVSGSVDYSKCGTYRITYVNNSDETFYKDVHVIDDSTNYILSNYQEKKVNCLKNHQVVDIKNIDDNSYYLISNYQNPDPSYYDEEKICVCFYQNNEFVWEYHFHKYSRFVSSYLYNDNLIVTGLVYNEDNNYINSIILFEVTKNRKIIKEREIKAEESCYVSGLYMYDDFLYLVTNTNGVKGDYKDINVENVNHLIVLKLSYSNFKTISYYIYDDLLDFRIVDCYFHNSRITTHIKYNKKREVNGNLFSDAIYEIDDSLSISNVKMFNLNNDDYLGYGVGDNIIFYLGIDKKKSNCVKVQYLHDDCLNKQIFLDKTEVYDINNASIIAIKGDSVYLSLSHKKGSTSHFIGYSRTNLGGETTYFKDLNINSLPFKMNFYLGNLYTNYYKEDILYTKKVDLIEFRNVDIDDSDYQVKEKDVLYNFDKLVKSSSSFNYDKFGTYDFVNHYKDPKGANYYFRGIRKVNLKTNISDNGVYQVGKKIYMNGAGSLNGEAINSGYELKQIGKYLLVITGNNGENVALNFEIKDLTVDFPERETEDFKVTDITSYKEEKKDDSKITVEQEIKEYHHGIDTLSICISIVLFGVLCFIFLRKKI